MPLTIKALKYLVILYNIIFVISGFAVFILNCIFLYQFLRYSQFVSLNLTAPAITLIIIGLLSCFFAWVGWRAACALHQFHVVIFGVLLLLVVVVQLSCSIWALVLWDNLKDEVTAALDMDFLASTEHKYESAVKRWTNLQTELQCCGVGGISDYRSTAFVPLACCSGSDSIVGGAAQAGGDCGTLFQRGCLAPLIQTLKEVLLNVCFTALGAGLLQASGLLCTFYLATALRAPPRSPRRPAPAAPEPAADTLLPPPKY